MALSSQEMALQGAFRGPSSMDLSQRNFVVKERYKVLELKAETSRTNVFLAWDTRNRERVFLHVVKNSFFRRSNEVQIWVKSLKSMRRFKDFAEALRVAELDLWKKKLVVVTADFDGVPLMQLMNRADELPIEFVLKLLKNLALALQHAVEARIPVRNLSREDVFVNDQGAVRILRFSPSRLGRIEESMSFDATGDLYFLGTLLFELLLREAPFSAQRNHCDLETAHLSGALKARQSDLQESVRNGLVEIFERCVTRDMDKRFTKTDELVDKISRICDEIGRIRTEMEIRTDKEQLNSAFDVVHALRGEAGDVQPTSSYSRVWSSADRAQSAGISFEGWFRLLAVVVIVASFTYKLLGGGV